MPPPTCAACIPQHPQFEKLRQAYLANKGKPLGRKILANMEEWRWMPDDLGQMHIMANVPEFMVYLVKDGARIHAERIVVGETGKQTTIFSRNLKTIVFKPMWRVPEFHQGARAAAQPAARRQHVPPVRSGTADQGRPAARLPLDRLEHRQHPRLRGGAAAGPQERDGRRQVHVPEPAHDLHARHRRQVDVRQRRAHAEPRLPAAAQPDEDGRAGAGRGQGLGRRQGCTTTMRTARATTIIVIEKKIPMHLVYFTAWVGDDGKLRTFGDIYGHEKRISLALEGKWDQIDIGRDHLAPVEASDPSDFTPAADCARQQRRSKQPPTIVDMVGNALGGGSERAGGA